MCYEKRTFGCDKSSPYLYGRAFTLRTDHAALRWLLNFRCSEGQTARWLQELQQYNFKVEHRRGLKHKNADALSRRPCLSSDCRHCTALEAKEELQREEEHGEEFPCLSTVISAQTNALSMPWSRQDLREAQMRDVDLRPVLLWKEKGEAKPTWQIVAPYSETTKTYWVQWESLLLRDVSTLSLVGNSSWRKFHKAASPTKGTEGRCPSATSQLSNCWAHGSKQNP